MKTKTARTSERPRMKLAALQERTRLREAIQKAEARIRALHKQADQENGINGLIACGRFKAVFVVSEIRPHGYIEGVLQTEPDRNYDLQKEFGQEHYHWAEGFSVDGVSFRLRGDDGRLGLTVSLPDCEITDKTDQRPRHVRNAEKLPARVKLLGRILKSYGIRVSANAIESKRADLQRDIDAQTEMLEMAKLVNP